MLPLRRDIAPLLRRIIFIRKPPLRLRFDFQRIGLRRLPKFRQAASFVPE